MQSAQDIQDRAVNYAGGIANIRINFQYSHLENVGFSRFHKITSNIMTKPVERELIDRHLATLGMAFKEGRHHLTPTIAASTTTGDDGILME